MKNISTFPLAAIFFVGAVSNGFATENQTSTTQKQLDRPNRVYFGPEFLSFQIDTHVKNSHVNGRRSFWGIRFGYERLKPESFYAGAELMATNAGRNFLVSNKDFFYKGEGGAGFGNMQVRFGYTLPSSRHLVTPFLGLGVYSLSKRGHNGFKELMGYLSGGVRTRFECTPRCLIGLNAEVFRTLGNEQSITLKGEKVTDHTNGWGCNVGVPLTIRLSRGWDMQFTPYFLRLLFSETQNIYGTSLLFGYRF
jgi:hypothetical protein